MELFKTTGVLDETVLKEVGKKGGNLLACLVNSSQRGSLSCTSPFSLRRFVQSLQFIPFWRSAIVENNR